MKTLILFCLFVTADITFADLAAPTDFLYRKLEFQAKSTMAYISITILVVRSYTLDIFLTPHSILYRMVCSILCSTNFPIRLFFATLRGISEGP